MVREHSTEFAWAAFLLLGRWLLINIGLELLALPIGVAYRAVLQSAPTILLMESTILAVASFLLALRISPIWRQMSRGYRCFSLGKELNDLYGHPFSWMLITAIFIISLSITNIAGIMGEYLVGLLPASWGIATEDSVAQMLKSMLIPGGINRLLQVCAICVAPAIVEELFFRAGIQRLLIAHNRHHPIRAIVLTALIFSLIHFSLVGLIARFAMGFIFGYMYYRTGRLSLPILLHFLNNLVSLIMLIHEI